MMQFGNVHLLWLIFLLPALLLLRWGSTGLANKRLRLFAEEKLLAKILPSFGQRQLKEIARSIFSLLALACLIIALLRPQWGFTWVESKKRGIDIMVAVDVSLSMMAEDIKPNRLQRARRELVDLGDRLRGDRIGLVAFAGVAFTECPLTLDYGAFRLFLESLSQELIPVRGTNIEDALNQSLEAFQLDSEAAKERSRAILLITDGEDFEGDFAKLAQKAKDKDVKIYIMGIGSLEGSPIPLKDGYKKDKNGNLVITRLNQEALVKLASETGGVFVNSITSERDTITLYDLGIKKAHTDSQLEGSKTKRWNEYFQVFLAMAIIFLVLACSTDLIFRNPGVVLLILSLGLQFSLPTSASAESSERLGANGKELLKQGEFQAALDSFDKAQSQSEKDVRFLLGKGASLYRLQRFDEASATYLQAAANIQDKNKKAESLYNAGNSLVQLGSYQEAIKSYEESLALNPDDKEAKENLEYAKRLLKQQQEQEKKEQNQDQSQNQDQDQEKEQNQDQENNQDSSERQKNNQGENNKDSSQSEREEEKQEEQEQEEEQKKKDEEEQEGQNRKEEESKEEEREQPASSGGKEQEAQSQPSEVSSVLGSVEEDRKGLLKFRLREAMKRIQSQNVTPPEKDW